MFLLSTILVNTIEVSLQPEEFLMSDLIVKIQGVEMTNRNLLAVPVGIKQKGNVDAMVKKVLYNFLSLS